MHDIVFRPTAQKDLQSIVDYYDLINPKLSDVFLSEMEQAANQIKTFPLSCQLRLKNIRVYFMKRYNYGVYFKLYDTTVVVIAI